MSKPTREGQRLEDARNKGIAWRKWGPYLSERQWGSVRENTDRQIEAWNDLTHDQSRSRAYQSGEDGIAGFCDDNMLLCFSVAMWNGKDPILKERMFGLTNSEGNHGEDVKEYYFYLDSTPTHSYAKMLYKYPQAEFPYYRLVDENRRRTRNDMEFELLDTGIFDENRYFDVYVEFAKVDPEDILIRISAVNRGPEAAPLHILPHLWFRNTWCVDERAPHPEVEAVHHPRCPVIAARHPQLGQRFLYCEGAGELLFADNETNRYRLWGQPNPTTYQKDGINDYVVQGRRDAVNPAKKGTKSAAHTLLNVEPGQTASMRLRLTMTPPGQLEDPMSGFDAMFAERLREADDFYAAGTPHSLSADAAQVVRQGAAGLLWTKQAYVYDVETWLHQRGVQRDSNGETRNQHWFHMYTADVISMPDKWEYPWFAAWDLAFHSVSLAWVDPDLAEQQLGLMLLDRYQHPNGQLPAYEWNFDDVNPPVHAWAAIFNYRLNRETLGDRALPFLKKHLQHAGLQLHLVAQPQGSRRPQPVRRRVPGPGQHRRLRSQRAAADRRLPGAGRRHLVDGVLRAEHAGHGAGAGAGRPELRRAMRSSSISTWWRSRPPPTASAPIQCGTKKTASTTTCCVCPVSSPRGSRCARSSGCCRCARSRSIVRRC